MIAFFITKNPFICRLMNIHYFQHVPFEGLGSITDWVNAPGNKVTATRFYEDNRLPFVDICDMLIVMGGPMGVHDEKLYPWLKKEKKFIEKAIAKGKKVVGICLGAQLIADVLGAKVYPNGEKEIGWHPIEFKPSPLLQGFPPSLTVFHWHGDTFELPKDAAHLASSKACENQAYLYGEKVLGLQFHMEATDETITNLLQNCGSELVNGAFIQKEEDIIGHPVSERNNNLLQKLLSSL